MVYISDFQTREKLHYLKTKQQQIAKHHLQTKRCYDGDSNALLMCNYHRQTDWAKHSLQASSPIGGVARRSRESSTRKETRVRKGRVQRSQINFHFHPGNRKTLKLSPEKRNVSAVCQLPSLGQAERASYTSVVRSSIKKYYNFAQKQDYRLKENNWCGTSSLNRSL